MAIPIEEMKRIELVEQELFATQQVLVNVLDFLNHTFGDPFGSNIFENGLRDQYVEQMNRVGERRQELNIETLHASKTTTGEE